MKFDENSVKKLMWFFARPTGPKMSSDGFGILQSKLDELIQFRTLYTSSTQKSKRPWNANISLRVKQDHDACTAVSRLARRDSKFSVHTIAKSIGLGFERILDLVKW